MITFFSHRYEQEQAIVQEELLRLAKKEREAASERLSASLQRERTYTDEEKQKTAQLVSIRKYSLQFPHSTDSTVSDIPNRICFNPFSCS